MPDVLEAMRCLDDEPGSRLQAPTPHAADEQLVARHADISPILAEHDVRHGQVERADSFEGNDGNGVLAHKDFRDILA